MKVSNFLKVFFSVQTAEEEPTISFVTADGEKLALKMVQYSIAENKWTVTLQHSSRQ